MKLHSEMKGRMLDSKNIPFNKIVLEFSASGKILKKISRFGSVDGSRYKGKINL